MSKAKDEARVKAMIPEFKQAICQILTEESSHWLYPRAVVRELDQRLSGPLFKKSFWAGYLPSFLSFNIDMPRERALHDALKELLKEGRIVSSLGAYKIVETIS